MRIAFHHTHVYPGCRASLADDAGGSAGPAEIAFADGAVATGSFARAGPDELRLVLPAHVTARGTAIAAKAWILRRVADDAWKVAARSPAAVR